MRVAHVITRLIVGGAQENTIASVVGLRQQPACEATLISGPSHGAEGSLESFVREQGVPLTIVPDLIRPVHPFRDWQALRELTRFFIAQKPDIVHTHSSKAGVLGRLAAARAQVPVIVHTIHGPSFGPWQNPLANWLFTGAERRAARVTTHFVSVADAMTAQYLRAGIGSPARFTTIRSGFDLEPFLRTDNAPALRAELGLAPDDIVVGKIARLFKLKGHEDLLAVAPELIRRAPHIKLLFLGDGPWRRKFEAQAAALGIRDRVVFAGLVPPQRVAQYVGVMDLLVHLSRREGLPRALPQALAAARPVVAFDADGAREVCRDGETGFLVAVGDQVRLRESILRLAGDPELRARLGHAGRSLVQEQFSTARMVEQIYALYQRLLNQTPGR